MDVILLERVEKLGKIGDVVSVKPGYARNFLLPRKKALRANDSNRKHFEANRAVIETANAQARDMAAVDAKLVDGQSVTLIRQGVERRRAVRLGQRARCRGSARGRRGRQGHQGDGRARQTD